jgi:hypothetical protein
MKMLLEIIKKFFTSDNILYYLLLIAIIMAIYHVCDHLLM